MTQESRLAKRNMLGIYREPGLNPVLTVPCCAFRFSGVMKALATASAGYRLSPVGYSTVPTVDAIMVEERAASFTKRSLKTSAKLAGLKMAVSICDLTTLEGKDTPGKIAYLCRTALQPIEAKYNVPSCAAVCVYPNMVKYAAVATGFPSGQVPLPSKLQEVRRAVGDGADEIDMVVDRCAFLAGEHA